MNARPLVLAAFVAAFPVLASAQTVGHAQPVSRSVGPAVSQSTGKSPQRYHPVKLGPHTFYGTITAINGTNVTIRTRRNRVVNIDASTVLADGTYSAPLFVGKLVTIDGNQSASGVFTAAHIFRMTNLSALPDDH